jgi:hypothetical protein
MDFSTAEHAKMAQSKFRKTSLPKSQKTRRQRLMATRQIQPKSTEKAETSVPPPQSARIMQRYVGGASIRQIAREEQRDRATVTKIVRSDQMQTFVQELRERFYGLGFDALAAVQHALQKQKDAQIGYQLLTDIGAVPSSEERYAVATQPMSMNNLALTPFEIAVAEDEDGRINRVAYGMACVIEESAKTFGISLPTAEEYRHLQKVARVADEIAGGRFHQICMTDGPEEKRIRQLAEHQVNREEARRSLPSHRTPRALPHKRQAALGGPLSSRN